MKTLFLVLAFVSALIVAFILPFDWWQKAPSRQKDKLIGKLLGGFLDISLRNVLFRTLLLGQFLYSYILLCVFIPMLVPLILAGMFVRAIHQRLCLHKRELSVPLAGQVIIVLLGCIIAFGLLAPLRVIPIIGYLLLGRPAGNFWEGATIGADWIDLDVGIGLAGLIGLTLWFFIDSVWRLRQYRQVENIATSKVRSIAMGLVELKGTVRPTFSGPTAKTFAGTPVEITDGLLYGAPQRRIDRFMLEDDTGEVLIDARECRIRSRWLSELWTVFGVPEIVLTRRKERNEFMDAETRTLQYGDRVYVIGNAERDSLGNTVVRPAARPGWNAVLWRTVFGVIRPPKSRDIHDVFFLTDGDEDKARRSILRGFRITLSIGLVWLASSLFLLFTSQQEWRQEPPPDSWRNHSWRGPEPNPDPMVIDYSRNKRLFRFEKYLKTIGPQSYDAIPALREAMEYSDPRFSLPARRAYQRIMAGEKHGGKVALEELIADLHPCPRYAEDLQTTILALGNLGPKAAPAVPKLIEQLGCQQTDNYVISPNLIREAAAESLGKIGPAAAKAVPALEEVMQSDPSPAVKNAARRALRKIRGSEQAGIENKRDISTIDSR